MMFTARGICAVAVSTLLLASETTPTEAETAPNFSMEDVLRVIGGTDASTTDYPWMASVEIVSASYEGGVAGTVSTYCGGILIAPDWVLTAAHCIDAEGSLEGGAVVVGKQGSCFTQDCSADVNFRQIDDIFIPDEWLGQYNQPVNGIDVASDLALIRLGSPITTITPVQISDTAFAADEVDLDKQYATVLGWGLTDGYDGTVKANNLQALDNLGLINRNDCISPPYLWPNASYVPATAFCAQSYSVGKDACSGDSGGPLYSTLSNKVIGVTSLGYRCGEAGYPGVYTDVGSMYNWIIETTGPLSDTTTNIPNARGEYEKLGQGCCEDDGVAFTNPNDFGTSGMSSAMCADSCDADSQCFGYMFNTASTMCTRMDFVPTSRSTSNCQSFQCFALVGDIDTTSSSSTTTSTSEEPVIGSCPSQIGTACRRGGRRGQQ